MSQHDPDLTISRPDPAPASISVGGRRMSFAGGLIREIPADPPDAEIADLRARAVELSGVRAELVALRQLIVIYLGTEEARTSAGRAQAEVLRGLCAPRGGR